MHGFTKKMSHLGQIILERRKFRGMSLQHVADEAKLTKAHVWDLEVGRSRNPCMSTILGLAAALDISPLTLASAAIADLPGVRITQKQETNHG